MRQQHFIQSYGIPIPVIIFSLLYATFTFAFRAKLDDKGVSRHLWDFYVYYVAGNVVVTEPQSLYNSTSIVSGYVNLPIIAYLFTPFSLLPREQSEILFFSLSVLSIFAIIYFLIKITNAKGWARTSLIVLIALNHPLFNSIRLGNTTHFVLLLLLGSFGSWKAGKQICVGIFLALSSLIKLPLILLLIYFLISRQWKAFFSALVTLSLVMSASIFLFGGALNLTWFSNCVLPLAGKALTAFNVQSISSFLIRIFTDLPVGKPEISWLPLEPSPLFRLLYQVLIVSFLSLTFIAVWKPKTQDFRSKSLDFSIFLVLSLLISPLSWTHYYLFLLLPMSLFITKGLLLPKNLHWYLLMIIGIFLLEFPSPYILLEPFTTDAFWSQSSLIARFILNLVISSSFIGALLVFGTLLATKYLSTGQKI